MERQFNSSYPIDKIPNYMKELLGNHVVITFHGEKVMEIIVKGFLTGIENNYQGFRIENGGEVYWAHLKCIQFGNIVFKNSNQFNL